MQCPGYFRENRLNVSDFKHVGNMMKIRLNTFCMLLVFSCLSPLASQSQLSEDFRLQFDFNGLPIITDVDMDFCPIDPVEINYTLGAEFQKSGKLYINDSSYYEGRIKYVKNYKYFLFEDSLTKEIRKVYPDDCVALVLGRDSFVSISGINTTLLGIEEKEESEFAEVIDEINGVTYYRSLFWKVKVETVGIETNAVYFYKKSNGRSYKMFKPEPNELKEQLLSLMSDCPYIIDDIQNEYYSVDNLNIVIRLYRYFQSYKNKEKIFFDESWHVLESVKSSVYYGMVESFDFFGVKMKFFTKAGVPLYKGNFYSFHPLVGKGEFIFYRPDGSIKKIGRYATSARPWEYEFFYPNGNRLFRIQLVDEKLYYDEVLDSFGENILDSRGNGNLLIQTLYDDNQLICRFRKFQLEEAYYRRDDASKVIIYRSDKRYENLANVLKVEIRDKLNYTKNNIEKGFEGYLVYRVRVDSHGKLCDIQQISETANDEETFLAVRKELSIILSHEVLNLKLGEREEFEFVFHLKYLKRPFYKYIGEKSLESYISKPIEPVFHVSPLRFGY